MFLALVGIFTPLNVLLSCLGLGPVIFRPLKKGQTLKGLSLGVILDYLVLDRYAEIECRNALSRVSTRA